MSNSKCFPSCPTLLLKVLSDSLPAWNFSRMKFKGEIHLTLAQENRTQHILLRKLTVTMRATLQVSSWAFPHLWQLPYSFYLSRRLGLCLSLDLWDLHLSSLLLLLPQKLEVSRSDGFAWQLDCWCSCEKRKNKMLRRKLFNIQFSSLISPEKSSCEMLIFLLQHTLWFYDI